MQIGRTIRVGGWVRTGREAGAGAFAFLEVNDGSCFDSLQVRPDGPARAAQQPVPCLMISILVCSQLPGTVTGTVPLFSCLCLRW